MTPPSRDHVTNFVAFSTFAVENTASHRPVRRRHAVQVELVHVRNVVLDPAASENPNIELPVGGVRSKVPLWRLPGDNRSWVCEWSMNRTVAAAKIPADTRARPTNPMAMSAARRFRPLPSSKPFLADRTRAELRRVLRMINPRAVADPRRHRGGHVLVAHVARPLLDRDVIRLPGLD